MQTTRACRAGFMQLREQNARSKRAARSIVAEADQPFLRQS